MNTADIGETQRQCKTMRVLLTLKLNWIIFDFFPTSSYEALTQRVAESVH